MERAHAPRLPGGGGGRCAAGGLSLAGQGGSCRNGRAACSRRGGDRQGPDRSGDARHEPGPRRQPAAGGYLAPGRCRAWRRSRRGGFKDGDSRIKKQVQRFRLYAFDAEDPAIGELTAGAATVERLAWSVRLATHQGRLVRFQQPARQRRDYRPACRARRGPVLRRRCRSRAHAGHRRRQARPSPAPRSTTAVAIRSTASSAASGRARRRPGRAQDRLRRGACWVRAAGRQVELAGRCRHHLLADNDGRHDDWCDGPVTAEVTLAGGRRVTAEPWVACVGPHFTLRSRRSPRSTTSSRTAVSSKAGANRQPCRCRSAATSTRPSAGSR